MSFLICLRRTYKLLILIISTIAGIAVIPVADARIIDFTQTVLLNSDEKLTVINEEVFNAGVEASGILWNRYRSWVCAEDKICPKDRDMTNYGRGKTKINVAFSDVHGSTTTLIAFASKTFFYPGEVLDEYEQPLNHVFNGMQTAPWNPARFKWRVSMPFPPGEIKKIPHGGIWTAKLNLMSLHGDDFRQPENDIIVNFKLVVGDFANAQIYFLDGGASNASISMPLHKAQTETNPTFSSDNSIDMCLYDGVQADSSSYNLTVLDHIEATEDKNYYLRSGIDINSAFEKIPLNVSILYNGNNIDFINGNKSTKLEKAQSGSIRSVSLPNIDGNVRCAIATLKLRIPNFNALEKRQGTYATKLKIIFTPNA